MVNQSKSDQFMHLADGQVKGEYTANELFESWDNSFSAYELYFHEDGTEDLKIIAANRNFAALISADYDTLTGRLFSDACTAALDWLPFYIQTAKTGKGNLHESYNQDLKKYMSALVFSPHIGQVSILVIDRTSLWNNEQALRAKNQDLSALFASMTTGFCVGRLIRNEQGEAIDLEFELVNAAFEILEGFPTSYLTGKRLLHVSEQDPYFEQYKEIAEKKKKVTFTKEIELNGFVLETICFSQTDDTVVCIESNVTERVRAEEKLRKAYATIEEQNKTILSSIDYASKIQKNMLPKESLFQEAFQDYSILWKPRDVVGGDLYWIKKFAKGTLLCVCDCTGHGTPGALLTMLAASIFGDTINEENCNDVAQLIHLLDSRIADILNVQDSKKSSTLDFNDGCDLAVLFIDNGGSVTAASASTHIFVCDGKNVRKIKGQGIHVGDGKIVPENIRIVKIPHNPKQKFYIASDGLFDQMGEERPHPFGYNILCRLILEHHEENQEEISGKVWEAFERHQGVQIRRDDVQLISFRV